MTAKGRPSSPKDSDAGPDAPRPEGGVLDALSIGLEEVLPGIEVLDRDLSFDGGHADLAAVDGAGRLVLVQLADKDADRAALDALDALAFARRHAEVLARHLGSRRLRPDLEPKLVVITASTDERVCERLGQRLAPLLDGDLELFGIRAVRSRRGERSYLHPLVAAESAAGGLARSPEAFLGDVSEELRPLALALVGRMTRLDDELQVEASRRTLSWRFRGHELARLERRTAGLVGRIPDQEELAVQVDGDLDRFVEGAMGRLVAVLGSGEPEADAAVEATPDEPMNLLSPEEIEAFRQ